MAGKIGCRDTVSEEETGQRGKVAGHMAVWLDITFHLPLHMSRFWNVGERDMCHVQSGTVSTFWVLFPNG